MQLACILHFTTIIAPKGKMDLSMVILFGFVTLTI